MNRHFVKKEQFVRQTADRGADGRPTLLQHRMNGVIIAELQSNAALESSALRTNTREMCK